MLVTEKMVKFHSGFIFILSLQAFLKGLLRAAAFKIHAQQLYKM
jgi:hypothetical protein